MPHRHLEEYDLRERTVRPPDDRGEYSGVAERLPT
jgi:hypothetical protein